MKKEQHGCRSTRLYTTWTNMKARCYRKTHPQYDNYGGRGIFVCEDWLKSFISFKEWAENNGYNDNLTIDRIDNNRWYTPYNCRWVDRKTQNNNKRNNILVDNTTLTLKCEELNIDSKLIQARIREQNMSFDEAIKLPHNFRHYRISYNNKQYSLKELCVELGLKYDAIYKRIKKYGWSLEKATGFKACEWIMEQTNGR